MLKSSECQINSLKNKPQKTENSINKTLQYSGSQNKGRKVWFKNQAQYVETI